MRTGVLLTLFCCYLAGSAYIQGEVHVTFPWFGVTILVGFLLGSVSKPPRYDD